jgi:phosphoribosylaminoimidazolecarboxamide formyltransferase / IMP cyclohydrolase
MGSGFDREFGNHGGGPRLGALASGQGSVLRAVLEAGLLVSVVVTDRECEALEVATAAGVPSELVRRESFGPSFDRSAYTRRLVEVLQRYEIDVVAMAGFGTVLSPEMFAAFPGRVLNTHPALLPAFKGWHAVRDALAAGVKVTGTTVHVATESVDDGPVLAQQQVPVLPGDTEETLHLRIKAVERRLYPATIRRFMRQLGKEQASPRRPVKALISVYDKTGLEEFASGLAAAGFELVASGKTAAALSDAGLPHTTVEAVTGSPEMLGGRVKTLHPRLHGGILADLDNPGHVADLARYGIDPIGLVVCNLYPFRAEPSVEMIDIGGVALLRGAAKNWARVSVVVDPTDYPAVLQAVEQAGELDDQLRLRLARKAFAHTAAYDAAIVSWFDEQMAERTPVPEEITSDLATTSASRPRGGPLLPPTLHLSLELAQPLRYGENPHQVGARYRAVGEPNWWDQVVQHGGMELSYLNLYDADAAWGLVHDISDLGPAAAVVVKHANPCGAAVSGNLPEAYEKAFECDPMSAFGGIVALSGLVDEELAAAMVANAKADVVIAPGYSDVALALFAAKRKNMRVLAAPPPGADRWHVRQISGSWLVQSPYRLVSPPDEWEVVTAVKPSDENWRDLQLAWRVCAAVKSNAIVLAAHGMAVGIGGGQQNRVSPGELAVERAAGRAAGGAGASDAYFPFRDGLDTVVASGVSCVVQPGGSVRDPEVIAAADEHGIAMVFTHERQFRH